MMNTPQLFADSLAWTLLIRWA